MPVAQADAAAVVSRAASSAQDRTTLWVAIIQGIHAATMAEVGVWRGEFAEVVLRQCPGVERYYGIDPWRHLDDWNKPANQPNDTFAQIKAEALSRTDFARDRRIVLQGKTLEVARQLPEHGLDFAYIDGDHTLRGITIDLLTVWPKMRDGGLVGGDDFCSHVWQHAKSFEPTFVFPFAVYFAEAVGVPIYALPFNQFALIVDRSAGFAFRDLTGHYHSLTVRDALRKSRQGVLRTAIWRLRKVFRKF